LAPSTIRRASVEELAIELDLGARMRGLEILSDRFECLRHDAAANTATVSAPTLDAASRIKATSDDHRPRREHAPLVPTGSGTDKERRRTTA
jgi:hypothetical protein